MDKILENIKHIEEKYKINYPDISSATYKSLVNYTNDIKKPIQRWYRYKEGYSVDLMQQIFIENGQTVNTDYTITASNNAGTFGPVTVATGVTVTVPTGSVWSIV